MTCSTASNSGKFARSGVGIGEGTTLKGTTFLLSDSFSIKGYSMNPVFLLPHLAWCEFCLFLRGHQLQRYRPLQVHPTCTKTSLFLISFRTCVSKCRNKNIQLSVSTIFFKIFSLLGNNCSLWLLLVSRRK